eukprot:6557894-Lingulodinium_polyedra.AAC.1
MSCGVCMTLARLSSARSMAWQGRLLDSIGKNSQDSSAFWKCAPFSSAVITGGEPSAPCTARSTSTAVFWPPSLSWPSLSLASTV